MRNRRMRSSPTAAATAADDLSVVVVPAVAKDASTHYRSSPKHSFRNFSSKYAGS